MITKNYKTGEYKITCDTYGCEKHSVGDDFMEVIDIIRLDGWIIKKVENNWYHFCSKECEKESLI